MHYGSLKKRYNPTIEIVPVMAKAAQKQSIVSSYGAGLAGGRMVQGGSASATPASETPERQSRIVLLPKYTVASAATTRQIRVVGSLFWQSSQIDARAAIPFINTKQKRDPLHPLLEGSKNA